MPCNLTHMFVAGQIALSFPKNHQSDVIRDIRSGFKQWLQANKDFRTGAENAISRNDGDQMQRVMDAYRAALITDEIAVFSAFTAGSQGPDLWTIPHGTWDSAVTHITGSLHFDLGHYNLSHAFPRAALQRVRLQTDKLPILQRKYQTAYILGYTTHIALDITAHIKVNVFAGAYFQLEKIWENEHGLLWVNIFNDHNKIEHYVDSLVRLICFEGCHPSLASFDSTRKNDFELSDSWNFPNYTDYWDSRLKFGTIFKTNGINNADETFLDNSTSLAGPFADRYYSSESNRRVLPFVREDFLRAYALCDEHLSRHERSIVNVESERIKLDFYRMTNDGTLSQYYLTHTVYPNLQRTIEFANRFFDPSAFAKFVTAGRLAGKEFVEGALKYLDSGDTSIFEQLRNWNLDLGLAIRIKDISKKEDSANPKKPPRPVCIELVNVINEVKALSDWKPPVVDAMSRYSNVTELWNKPAKSEPNPTPGAVTSGSSGTDASAVFYSQSGIDISLSGFKLYVDTDELAAYFWGEIAEPNSIISIPEDKTAYKISTCVEDFLLSDAFTKIVDRTSGKAKLKEYTTTFLGNIPPEPATGSPAPTGTSISEFGLRPLPRNLRISLCRKYVFKPTDSGNFSPDLFNIYTNPSPTEELAFSLFVFVKNNRDYTDLFSHTLFTQSQVEELKHIKQVGVNVILFLLSREIDTSNSRTRLKLLEAYVDGELQPVKEGVDDNPPPAIYRVEFEDAHFRCDSAVVMPDSLVYKSKTAGPPSPDLNEVDGLSIFQVIYIQAKENPSQKLLICGHTDRVGSDSYNIPLSANRAGSILCLLEGRKDDWRLLANAVHHENDNSQILAWANKTFGWNCNPGKIEGASTTQKTKAIKEFQRAYNRDFIDTGRVAKAYPGATVKRIGEDGDCGPETWGAFFDIYQHELAKKLDTTFENMSSFYSSLNGRWLDDTNKSAPCGETFPKEKPEEDNFESPVNRRVEILFFDQAEQPPLPLPCNSSDIALPSLSKTTMTSSSATQRLKNCTDNCPIYKGKPTPFPIHVTPHSRAQTAPLFSIPEFPNAKNEQPIDGLYVYFSYYDSSATAPVQIRKFRAKKGKLFDFGTDTEATVDADRDTFIYVSHRDDLEITDRPARFSKDKTGLPLLGPQKFLCGTDVKVTLTIWDQLDWVIIKSFTVDGKVPDAVFLADWKNNYKIGYQAKTLKGEDGFFKYGDPEFKKTQETWNYNSSPVVLPMLTSINGECRWVGTLSCRPCDEVKILLAAKRLKNEYLYTGSFNELKPDNKNIERNTFHTYNAALVKQLLSLKEDEDRTSAIDAFPEPPQRCILPGDMCWHDQKQTNFCGAFSFAAAMNYWYLCTNNFDKRDGTWYSDTSRIPSIINGARTPSNIREGAERFAMQTRENNADSLDKDRAIKLLKIWLTAGIPVLVLGEEDFGITSLHWKVVTGYDGNRIFYINSGGDHEVLIVNRTPGIDYESAPVGNDVDVFDDFYKKWKAAGSFIVGGVVATSVDPCILMPLYPQDSLFAGDSVQ